MNQFTILSCCLLLCLTVQAQQSREENSDEEKILRDWKTFAFQRDPLPKKIDLPQRKHDSPLFCSELLPYKKGFIINATTSNRVGRVIEVRTSFYYFDQSTTTLLELNLPGIDTIEAIVAINDDLFCSYTQKTGRIIARFANGQMEDLIPKASAELQSALNKAAWLKLGSRNDTLFALSPEGFYRYANNEWKQLTAFSLDRFYTEDLKYKFSLSTLPTTNIKISDSYVWFLQEVVQDRQCSLLKLDIKTGKLSEFFRELDYTDNYAKQVNDYLLLGGDTVLVTASRLWKNYLAIKAAASVTEVWIFANALKTAVGPIGPFEVTAPFKSRDTFYFAGANGLFAQHADIVRPLMLWQNAEQTIKEKKFSIQFDFVPRSLTMLQDGTFLVGGMWGGLYILNPGNSTIKCVDDIDSDKVKSMSIQSLSAR